MNAAPAVEISLEDLIPGETYMIHYKDQIFRGTFVRNAAIRNLAEFAEFVAQGNVNANFLGYIRQEYEDDDYMEYAGDRCDTCEEYQYYTIRNSLTSYHRIRGGCLKWKNTCECGYCNIGGAVKFDIDFRVDGDEEEDCLLCRGWISPFSQYVIVTEDQPAAFRNAADCY